MNTPPSRNRLILQIVVFLILCIAAIAVIIWSGAMKSPAGPRRVTLRVEASGGYALITLRTDDNYLVQSTTLTTPWEKIIKVENGTEIYLTASNPTQTGQLSCVIQIDGKSWKKDTTAAPKDGVACAGIVP